MAACLCARQRWEGVVREAFEFPVWQGVCCSEGWQRLEGVGRASAYDHVQIVDKTDSAGYPYVDVALPAARLELHVRRETGLLQLYQANGWRHDEALAPWQAELDQGAGVVEDPTRTMDSFADMFIGTHKRLLLESITDRARVCGAR